MNTVLLKSRGLSVKHATLASFLIGLQLLTACTPEPNNLGNDALKQTDDALKTIDIPEPATLVNEGKPVIYQIFTRLYGNKNTTNAPWATKEVNGVGHFNDINDTALESIKQLGITHIWYTGVPHHALVGDYSDIGITGDDPDVVKGRAGSPYAVKDYYNVNPDLATNPANRLQEFEALIERTHAHGMKVIIDIVPNHVARNYHSVSKPQGVRDFGQDDNTQLEYAKTNDFYYVVGSPFSVPDFNAKQQPLGGESHPLADGQFAENPAKWTGNGSRLAKPDVNDWYETVKINYGIKPDGSEDFPRLPKDFAHKTAEQHYEFWQQVLAKDPSALPSSWAKFNDIAQYWLAKGVDGFRYDMAEMVPVAFWSYLNSQIKHTKADAFILAEVYTPNLYRDYIQLGKMDYLYDKVGLYDTLKGVIRSTTSTAQIATDQQSVLDIAPHLLHFLENHDEQRIPSAEFAGNAETAMPAMVVSMTLSASPTLIYFGQEVGEDGSEQGGFGQPTRTSIFDYVGVPAHQRWMNNGLFDGGQSTVEEKQLRQQYQVLLNLSHSLPALSASGYRELDTVNRNHLAMDGAASLTQGYDDKVFAFARFAPDSSQGQKLIVVSNFDAINAKAFALHLPMDLIDQWGLSTGHYSLTNALASNSTAKDVHLTVTEKEASIALRLAPLESVILVVAQ